VVSLVPGKEVFGLAHGCLGTIVVGSAATLALLPPSVSYVAAATIPTVFITADVALNGAAGLQRGERVLLHAGAGGVGLAALQVAHALGARVIATAGSPSKRTLLRSRGVHAVLGSRDAGFASAVVLNSLTSPGMVAGSLAALRRGGRMVEIGKRDVWSAAAAAAERPDVSYGLVAVDFLRPLVLGEHLQRVAAQVAAGKLQPLRAAAYSLDLRSVTAAMRLMTQATHVGKVCWMWGQMPH
jgi:NADPH:quinone reductase-like Zn-dependent oxidoreductase